MANPAGATPPTAELTWKELLLSPLTELNKLLYFIGWAIPLLVLSFVPVINVAAPVLWAFVQRLDAGLGVFRLSARQPGLSFRDQRRLLRKRWPLTLSFGGMTLLLTPDPGVEFSGHAGGGDRRDPDVGREMPSEGMAVGDPDSSATRSAQAHASALYRPTLSALAAGVAVAVLAWSPGCRTSSALASDRVFVPMLSPGGLWVHAVSVGETRAALPLIRALLDRYPDRPLLVTTTTLTGSVKSARRWANACNTSTRPTICPGATRRFLRRVRPSLAVIMETELWPNLLRQCATVGIRCCWQMPGCRRRSARGYGRIRGLTAAMLRNVTLIAAQADADAARFRRWARYWSK